MGPTWVLWAPCWPQEPCYQGKEESQPYSAGDRCAGNLVSLDPRVQSCCLTLFSLFDHWLKIGSCGLFIQMLTKYISVKGFGKTACMSGQFWTIIYIQQVLGVLIFNLGVIVIYFKKFSIPNSVQLQALWHIQFRYIFGIKEVGQRQCRYFF